jgi:hypothetical protein
MSHTRYPTLREDAQLVHDALAAPDQPTGWKKVREQREEPLADRQRAEAMIVHPPTRQDERHAAVPGYQDGELVPNEGTTLCGVNLIGWHMLGGFEPKMITCRWCVSVWETGVRNHFGPYFGRLDEAGFLAEYPNSAADTENRAANPEAASSEESPELPVTTPNFRFRDGNISRIVVDDECAQIVAVIRRSHPYDEIPEALLERVDRFVASAEFRAALNAHGLTITTIATCNAGFPPRSDSR